MFVIITLLSLGFGVKFSKSLESGIRMAIALTGMTAAISLLTEALGPALQDFVKSTGVDLHITDLGWAPMAVITWGSIYTLYFAFICTIVNLLLLFTNKTKTLNVDLFNIWNISIIGLLVEYYAHNMIITSLFVIMIYTLMLKNSDVLKPSINKVLNYDENNVTTTAHPSLLIAPFVFVIDIFITKFLPFIDKFDFNAETLNKKIGFWGSKFAIGVYLGAFIGVLGQQSLKDVLTLGFTTGVVLELFAYIGGWFGPAIEPLSNRISSIMSSKLRGRKLFIGIDWPILASSAELWAVVNILAPILLFIAMFLPGNNVLPLGGILLTVLVPALLLITKGKVIRMTIIGTILLPLFLWAATMISSFLTNTSKKIGEFPSGLSDGQMFSSVDSDPIEKMLGMLVGNAWNTFDIQLVIPAVIAVIVYISFFFWYFKAISKKDQNSN
ncbi:PTS galactitol transporter subunit IIC [Staphylococcus sp. HMSC068D03]|uniref:Galactitol permease IIC component n=2 Tax=Staphylococcus TaxID=1279 RepID=A0A6N3ETN4_STASI|nr:PTS galactitol transporter subunit IIC [Staphylococcus haemolyticus]OFK33825.1 PTS galactitol transporter subunit IIC [Staphylococcus sp. HMSC065C10]OFM20554.1 PTS galactitol transporter subunit IIC [Staphylococcus sp. HMSC059E03]OFM58076.1 PTS galactitol transporter subunit IIC [Staphylococcus sp. HMSC059G05]OFP31102.1 PTS galactitol transporter subunit IIC [Staphylococcus sp. HMSC068H08]OFQ26783.1 PTS galactitol transporter subunit IIC [Staphylococcus sp. HMSC076H12]OFR06697.1 PTS galact